jgi:hypothetical protein
LEAVTILGVGGENMPELMVRSKEAFEAAVKRAIEQGYKCKTWGGEKGTLEVVMVRVDGLDLSIVWEA